MSLLPSATFAGPSQAEALWAVAGSTGPGGGVTQLVAGSNITLDPPTGEGVVTINATGGGGGGGVSSVTASGAGITATPTTGAVVLANTGVTSLVAGSGISVSGASGAVTVSATPVAPSYPFQTFTVTPGVTQTFTVTGNSGIIFLASGAGSPAAFIAQDGGWRLNGTVTLTNPSWNENTLVMCSFGQNVFVIGGSFPNQTVTPQGVCCSLNPSLSNVGVIGAPTERVLFVSGQGSVPNNGFSYGYTVQFVVFQGVPV